MNSSYLNQHPEFIAIGVAICGIIVAGFIARWFEKLLNLLDRFVRKISPLRADQLATATPRGIISRVVYYATVIFFLLLAIRILGIFALTEWLDLFLGYIPQILLGGFIIISGYLLGILVYSVVSNLLHPGQSKLLPRLAQFIVVITAVMTGLEQMKIDVTFVTNVIVIILASCLGGLSLAFALGSKTLVANLLARRGLAHLAVGDTIIIGDARGIIIEFTATGVALETEAGVTHIPSARFLELDVTVVSP
ncbi:mechanosensitive ion channel family protein [Dasania marina]|uniref:mechanosensitive ion channel family protein n=1 Tax=Dasania marina TaxID=471499 RepID=UPI00037A99CF|nr:mechanosensitive ion channel [Dasania marina]